MSFFQLSCDFKSTQSVKDCIKIFENRLNSIFVNDLTISENVVLVNDLEKRISTNNIFEINNLNVIRTLVLKQTKIDLEDEKFYALFSQCYLFQKALEYNLYEEVLQIIKKLVAYSVRKNNSSYLWIDDKFIYGIDLLTILALNNSKFIHYISEFITPSWEITQDSYVIFNYLPYFYFQNGFSKNMIKAIAYCNNFDTFKSIANATKDSNEELYEYFKTDKKGYEYFKKECFNYLSLYPRVSENSDLEHIVNSFFKAICKDEVYRNMANETFYEVSLKEEIELFAQEVDAFLEQFTKDDYVFLNEINDDVVFEYEFEGDFEKEKELNKEFFIKGFESGRKILDYIYYGTNKEILNTLKKIEFKSFSKRKNLQIYKRFEYFGTDYLYEIIDPFLKQYKDEHKQAKQSFWLLNFFIKKQGSFKEKALRALDVFYILNGRKNLDSFTIDLFTRKYKICKRRELLKRY